MLRGEICLNEKTRESPKWEWWKMINYIVHNFIPNTGCDIILKHIVEDYHNVIFVTQRRWDSKIVISVLSNIHAFYSCSYQFAESSKIL